MEAAREKRILHNYFRVFQLTNLQMTYNEESLYVDRESIQFVRQEEHSRFAAIVKWCRRIGRKFKRFAKHKVLRRALDRWEGRHTNLTDEISTQILQSFFPIEVWRADPLAKKGSISISEFLGTHLNLSSGHTTPRIILMFAQSCVDSTIDFYKKNFDIAGTKPFPVLTKDLVLQAYQDFKTRLWNMIAAESKQWRAEIETFRANFAQLGGGSFEQVQDAFPAKSDEDLRELLAVLQHLGIVWCVNDEFKLEQRYYQLPILFRQGEPE